MGCSGAAERGVFLSVAGGGVHADKEAGAAAIMATVELSRNLVKTRRSLPQATLFSIGDFRLRGLPAEDG